MTHSTERSPRAHLRKVSDADLTRVKPASCIQRRALVEGPKVLTFRNTRIDLYVLVKEVDAKLD